MSKGEGIEKAASNALVKPGIYCSTRMPAGGINGLTINGDTPLLPGVNICKSGTESINALYSVLVGSTAKNGMSLLANCNKRLIAKGKKVKSKNVAPSIKLKLNEAKNRIQFMKGIMDYSYPGFVLSKIKIMQKKLNEHKTKASYLNCLNEMQLRSEEQKKRNNNRKDYLLKCITLVK